jgi:hypothetical protein
MCRRLQEQFCSLQCFCAACFPMQGKVQVTFRDEQTKCKAGEMASNVLKVINGSDKKMSFYMSLGIPEGWAATRSFDMLYQVEAGDSLFIPVKLLLKRRDDGSTSYLISAGLIGESSNLQFASASWYLQIESESNWVASTDHNDKYFINNSDTSSFSLSIRNTGNSIEWYTIKVSPHFQVKLMDSKMNEMPQYFNLNLAPGTDTVFHFITKLKPNTSTGFHRGLESGGATESYPVRVSVQALNKDQSPGRIWKATVDFRRNKNEIRFNEFSREVLPMTLEARIDNLLEASTTMSINLYGTKFLEKSRTLTYRFQSFFSQQYYNEKAFRGNYHYIGYFAPKSSVELGNISGWRNFGITPSGRGIKGETKIGITRVGLLYIQNPDLFTNPSVKTIGVRDELYLKPLTLVNYLQRSYNNLANVDGILGVTGADFKLKIQHQFSVRAGFSQEKYYGGTSPLNVTGYGGSINYSGIYKDFGFRFSTDYGSENYSGYRGVLNINTNVSWKQTERFSWSFTNGWFQQKPTYYSPQAVKFVGLQSISRRHELRLSVNNKTSNHSFRAAWYDDDLLNIHYITRGLGFDFHPAIKSQVRFVSTIFGSYVKLPDYDDIPGYFTAQVRSNLRYKSFNANVRYNYGPYQAFEHIRFARYRINHQSIFLNAYYGMWLLPNTLSLEPTVNYSYETIYRKGRFGLRPELFYYTRNGWTFNMYAEFLASSQKIARLEDANRLTDFNQQATSYRDINVGVGVKKDFGIPIPGRRFNTATITAFRDLNGNMKQDKNEEALENILITIKPEHPDSTGDMGLNGRGEEVITNSKGIAIFRNMPAGVYIISSVCLTENSGWFPYGSQTIILDKNKTIAIPYSKGIHLSGGIAIDYSVNSAKTKVPEISRIRISAVDSAGRVYSCLTGNDGHFDLYVPVGDYRVSINQNAIDDAFTLDQNMVMLSLTGKVETYHVTFRIREKERSVKVRRFTKDGTLVEEKQ